MARLFYKIIIPSLVIGYWSLVIFSGGCGDLDSGGVASVVVSPSTVTVGINQQKSFSAEGKNSLGHIVSVSPTWNVTGGIGTISSTGWFTASGTAGSGFVVATVGSIEGRAEVIITAKGWLAATLNVPGGGFANGITVALTGHPTFTDTTDTNGRCTLAGISAGSYEVTATDPKGVYLVASEEVTIVSGETFTWTTTLTPVNPLTTTTTTTLII